MAMPKKLRRVVLWGALALTLAAAAGTGREEGGGDVVEAVAPAVRSAPRPAQTPPQAVMLDKLQRRQPHQEVGELFTPNSWEAPPPPPELLPPPPPTAPPLPFTYFGKLVADGEVRVFLSTPERNLAVREGDVIDGVYRVDRIRAPLLTLTYLPLNIKQTMHIGETN